MKIWVPILKINIKANAERKNSVLVLKGDQRSKWLGPLFIIYTDIHNHLYTFQKLKTYNIFFKDRNKIIELWPLYKLNSSLLCKCECIFKNWVYLVEASINTSVSHDFRKVLPCRFCYASIIHTGAEVKICFPQPATN